MILLILAFVVTFRAKPLHKLCEYEGKPLPEDYKSDCYKDVDESDYACKEKYRIMVSKIRLSNGRLKSRLKSYLHKNNLILKI